MRHDHLAGNIPWTER